MDTDAALSGPLNSVSIKFKGLLEPEALNQWQTAFLLSWYDFHRYPDKGETVRIAILVSMAYQHGLHQIESEPNHDFWVVYCQ